MLSEVLDVSGKFENTTKCGTVFPVRVGGGYHELFFFREMISHHLTPSHHNKNHIYIARITYNPQNSRGVVTS